jgi:hypothetical protein
MSIPLDCVVKTVTALSYDDSQRVNRWLSQLPEFPNKFAWYNEQGYNQDHGPFYTDEGIVRYWRSRDHADIWIGMHNDLALSAGIAPKDIPMRIEVL